VEVLVKQVQPEPQPEMVEMGWILQYLAQLTRLLQEQVVALVLDLRQQRQVDLAVAAQVAWVR
jgi:hypothetical protein